jgi:integrase
MWYADCYYWADGRRQRKQRSTGIRDDGTVKSQQTAELNARDIELSLALGQNRVARPTTLTQAMKLSVEVKTKRGRAKATIEITIEKAVHLYNYFRPDTPLELVTKERIEAYTDASLAIRQSPTVKRELRELRLAFKAAGIPVPKMPELKDGKPRERWLPPAEQLRLLLSIAKTRKDHLTMYLHLGLSKGELYRIDPSDCDFAQSHVRVRGTKADPRDRVLPMTREVHDILWARLGEKPMFELWSEGNADRDLKAACRRAGIEPCSFNDLRRSFCTILAMAGVPPLHLQHLMGHADMKMISRVYARIGQGKHMHDAVANLPRLSAPREPLKLMANNDGDDDE